MNITVIGAGNSGLAMAAHLGLNGHRVILWNRSRSNIAKLIETKQIYSHGAIKGRVKIDLVTDDIGLAVADPDIIFITTPANSHKGLAELIGRNIRKECLIVLNPGRTFGALEFQEIYSKYNKEFDQVIAETQTIIYTCRKTSEDSVKVISLKNNVLISTFDGNDNRDILARLPQCIQEYFIPARSMIETSIGNVGMILHCAPLLLNVGWTENKKHIYKHYYEGITPSVGAFIEKIDNERIEVSKILGLEVESTRDWLMRTYDIEGDSLYECIQNNKAYKDIDAPKSLYHRYILEDIPCGLVPLESAGRELGLAMPNTGIIIDLASTIMNIDFRASGRNLKTLFYDENLDFKSFFNKGDA